MFYGKKKAITFSYDDGVTQDVRLIEILDKYGLKATFNINSECLGKDGYLIREGKEISHKKLTADVVAEVYKNHEVAVHTLTHPRLTELDSEKIIYEVEQDRKNLSRLVGYEVVGMAYPCGGVNNDDRVAEVIKLHTGVRYSRTITLNHSFAKQENLYRFNPTAFHLNFDENYRLCEEFFKPETEGVLYIWGHAYEFDINDTWDKFEEFCKFISARDDVFYGTNKEILLK